MASESLQWPLESFHGVWKLSMASGSLQWLLESFHGVWKLSMASGSLQWPLESLHGLWKLSMAIQETNRNNSKLLGHASRYYLIMNTMSFVTALKFVLKHLPCAPFSCLYDIIGFCGIYYGQLIYTAPLASSILQYIPT